MLMAHVGRNRRFTALDLSENLLGKRRALGGGGGGGRLCGGAAIAAALAENRTLLRCARVRARARAGVCGGVSVCAYTRGRVGA